MKPKFSYQYKLIVLVLLSFSKLSYSNSGKFLKPDSSICLELIGQIDKGADKTFSLYTVLLIKENSTLDTLVLHAGKTFKFFLRRNTWYTLKIIKEGCVPKLISVNTNLDVNEGNYIYKLSFVVDEPISELESQNLSADDLDFPLSLLAFDEKEGVFDYQGEYSFNIKKKLLMPLTLLNNSPSNVPTVVNKETIFPSLLHAVK